MYIGIGYETPFPRTAFATKLSTSRARKMKNNICAIPAAAPAIPPNPNKPAIKANTKNTSAQFNMFISIIGGSKVAV